ncbi:hypothetical protein BGZ57DRAFT_201927 [Hyaloscypha finlandica]|nr:hypothetical protein BGZ57DRAFT_201927 [Hyaloscypha finlandica]
MGFNIFAMPASSIVLLFSVALGVSNALPWEGPQPTNAYQPDAWSPVPTRIPADPANLFKRSSVGVNVCGWIGGNVGEPVQCASGSSCVHDTIHGYVGCCTTSGACTSGVYTSCVDSQSSAWNQNSGLADSGIYTCTGTSLCYRNTYPGGYYQYSCGASWEATSILTSYYGQPSSVFLQIVYTGVSSIPTTSATTTPAPTSSVSPTTTVTDTPSPPSQKNNIGAITGGTIGGVAFLAALLALAFFLYRRHQSKHHYRAGPFVSSHNTSIGQLPTSGPFERIGNTSYDTPDDFMQLVSPRSGVTTTSITAGTHPHPHPGTLVFPDTYAYAGAADPHHPYTNAPHTPYFPPDRRFQVLGTRERFPLVSSGGGSEIDDFSRGFNDAIAERLRDGDFGRDTHIGSGVLPGGIGGTGIGMGITGLTGNYRTEDREARSEAFRERMGERIPELRSNPVRGFSYDVVDAGRRVWGSADGVEG